MSPTAAIWLPTRGGLLAGEASAGRYATSTRAEMSSPLCATVINPGSVVPTYRDSSVDPTIPRITEKLHRGAKPANVIAAKHPILTLAQINFRGSPHTGNSLRGGCAH